MRLDDPREILYLFNTVYSKVHLFIQQSLFRSLFYLFIEKLILYLFNTVYLKVNIFIYSTQFIEKFIHLLIEKLIHPLISHHAQEKLLHHASHPRMVALLSQLYQ